MIFSHAGGTMPFLIVRLIKDSAHVPNGFVNEARRFYYDTAQAAGFAAMSALKRVVIASQIVFGTDYPHISAADTAKGLKDSGMFHRRGTRADGPRQRPAFPAEIRIVGLF
jgi:predicted TIM-barrel fold metal-dependent hydrolase